MREKKQGFCDSKIKKCVRAYRDGSNWCRTDGDTPRKQAKEKARPRDINLEEGGRRR
jgi:hypothetical protein